MRRGYLPCVVAIAVAFAAACSQTQPASTPAASPRSAVLGTFPPPGRGLLPSAGQLQREIQRWVDTGLLPGVTAAVVTPQGSWSGAAGHDGRGAVLVPTSGMAIASITKSITAAEVMLLAQRGKVELDSPASRYAAIPQLSNGVTVRQLLAQRAAIPDPGEGPYATVLTDLNRHWSVEEYLAPVARATDKPGERFYYDNTNYVLLGLVVRAASGLDVARAVTRDLWEPLGLERMAWQDAQRLAAPLARPGKDDLVPGRVPDGAYLPFRSLASAVGAAGGVAADAPSVARFGYELYGGRLLQARWVAAMTDFHDGDGYGLGTRDFTAGPYARWNIDAIGHDGATIGYRSVLAVFRKPHVSVAVLTPSTVDTVPYVQYLVKAGRLL